MGAVPATNSEAYQDYLPLDLSPWCNAPSDAAGGSPAPTGSRLYRGLPFLLGDPQRQLHLVVDPDSGPITVPVNRRAHRLLFAHRVFGHRGDYDRVALMGTDVASYGIQLAGGPEIDVPLRGRHEVAFLPTAPGDYDPPFLSAASNVPTLPDRHIGHWGDLGARQGEFCLQAPPDYVLWAWENPEPDVEIESVTITPRGASLLVGAITTCHGDEDPLLRAAAVPVRAVLPQAVDAGADVRIVVDRGESTIAHPLTPDRADGVARAAGWGTPAPATSQGWYAAVAALDSATVSVHVGDSQVGSVPWSAVKAGAGAADAGLRVEVVEAGREWVHVTVLDSDTGSPVPCRVRFRSPSGVPYPPHGHHGEVGSRLNTWHIDVGGDVRLGDASYAYIDGTCQGWLPRGEVVAEVARGFEYEPYAEVLPLSRGQRELTIQLSRWVSMSAEGWYSGDSHVHFLSAQGAVTEQQGEDLNVVNLLQSQWGSLFTNTEDFTGRHHVAAAGPYVTHVSQENRHHLLGHLLLWGLERPVMPWCSDGPPEADIGSALESTVSDWADRCHQQGGTVIVPHLPRPNGEVATLVATGRTDGVEMILQNQDAHAEYYRYLNAGFRLPLVGGTDKMSSEVPVGLYRTYAHLNNAEFSYEAWCEAVRGGRTFLSGGPLLDLSVEGRPIGDTVSLSGSGTVTVDARARSIFPLGTLQLVVNGRVVAQVDSAGDSRELVLSESISIDGDSWVAARCGGPGYFASSRHPDVWQRGVFAHTSPIYISCGRGRELRDLESLGYMQQLVSGGLEYVRHTSVQHQADTGHHHGESDHLAYLERPFREALERLADLMGNRG